MSVFPRDWDRYFLRLRATRPPSSEGADCKRASDAGQRADRREVAGEGNQPGSASSDDPARLPNQRLADRLYDLANELRGGVPYGDDVADTLDEARQALVAAERTRDEQVKFLADKNVEIQRMADQWMRRANTLAEALKLLADEDAWSVDDDVAARSGTGYGPWYFDLPDGELDDHKPPWVIAREALSSLVPPHGEQYECPEGHGPECRNPICRAMYATVPPHGEPITGGLIHQETRREMGVDAPDFGPLIGKPHGEETSE